jgi:hypothetical protein
VVGMEREPLDESIEHCVGEIVATPPRIHRLTLHKAPGSPDRPLL